MTSLENAYWVGYVVIAVLALNMIPDVWMISYGHNYGSPNFPFVFPLWCFMELSLMIFAYRNLTGNDARKHRKGIR